MVAVIFQFYYFEVFFHLRSSSFQAIFNFIDEKIESFIHYIMFHGITEVYHSCDPILRLIMTDAKLNIKIINRQQINTTVITKRAS